MNFIKPRFSILLKCIMTFSLLISVSVMMIAKPAEAASWKELDSNWKYRVDAPLSDGGKENEYHVHVKGKVNGKLVEGSETVTGGVSHKTTLDASGVPKWVQKEVKETPEFKKGKAKQKQLEDAKDKASKSTWAELLWDPTPIIDIAVIIGVTIYTYSMSAWKYLIFS